MAAHFNGQLSTTVSPPSPLVEDFFQKLNSLGTDFLWVFAQLRINKELKDQIVNISASNELLHRICNLSDEKVTSLQEQITTLQEQNMSLQEQNTSLESMLFDSNSDCDTDFSLECSTTLDEAQEKIKEQVNEIVNLKAENRRMEAEYQEALKRASDLIIARDNKIEELENGSMPQVNQSQDL